MPILSQKIELCLPSLSRSSGRWYWD